MLVNQTLVLAGQKSNPFTGKPDYCATIQEEDGSPSLSACQTIKASNGTLTDNGDGTVSLFISGTSALLTGWNEIVDPNGNNTIALGAFTTEFTSSLDGSPVMTLTGTDTDVGSDTPLFDLGSYDTGDPNGIFIRARSDVDGTPSTVFQVAQDGITAGVPITFSSSGGSIPGSITLYEPPDNGTNFTKIQTQAQAGDITLTLPNTVGSTNGLLQTDGIDTLTWTNTPSVTSLTASGTVTGAYVSATSAVQVGSDYVSDLTGSGLSVVNGALTAAGGSSHNILSATHSDTSAASATRGDLIVANSSPAWARFAVGGSNTVLTANGTDPAWSASPTVTNLTATSTVTGAVNSSTAAIQVGSDYISDITGSGLSVVNGALTAAGGSSHALLSATHSDTVANAVSRGSLIYGNSTPAWDELTVGGANTVLKADGTDASWTGTPTVTSITATNTVTGQVTVDTTVLENSSAGQSGNILVRDSLNSTGTVTGVTVSASSVLQVGADYIKDITGPGLSVNGNDALGVGAGTGISVTNGTVALSTPVSVGNGGTGTTTFTTNGVLYGNTASAVQVTSQGPSNSVLTANAGAPSFSATPTVTSLTATNTVTGSVVDIRYIDYTSGNGVTVRDDLTSTGNVTGLTVTAPTALIVGTDYIKDITGNGLQNASNTLALTTPVTVPNGGTAAATFTTNGVLYGNSTSALQVTTQGPANSVLTANAGAPSFSTNPTVTSLTATGTVTGLVISGTGAIQVGSDYVSDITGSGLSVVNGALTSSGGSGDITSVGDVASGAAFDGTQGTILTFNNAGGDATLDYDGTDFSFSKSITIGSGSNASETFTSVLSGASDPVWTYSNALSSATGSIKSDTTVTGAITVDTTVIENSTAAQSGNIFVRDSVQSTATVTGVTVSGSTALQLGSAYLSAVTGAGNILPLATSPNINASGSTFFRIPTGTNPTVNLAGSIAEDTTDGQWLYGSAPNVLTPTYQVSFHADNVVDADDNVLIFTPLKAVTITNVGCVSAGFTTQPIIALEDDSGNAMTHATLTCSATTPTTFIAVTAANTLTAGESLRFDNTQTSTAPITGTSVIITVTYTVTRS